MRSLSKNTFIVNNHISRHNLDCILLTETWLDQTGNAELTETSTVDYSFFRSTRTNTKRGGIAALYSKFLKCKSVAFGDFQSFEYSSIIVQSVTYWVLPYDGF